MLTIFTPTYNREKELERLYLTLKSQTSNDFEWLIVDDGSIDKTKSLIKKFIDKGKIKINYIYKKNGGKQSAYNVGLENAKGDIFLCIDSDDKLDNCAVKTILNDFSKLNKDNNICGMIYNQADINDSKNVIGIPFEKSGITDTYYNFYNKRGISGDKMIVFYTDIAKKYPFPIIEGEKFVPEALIYNRISKKYKLMCSNEVVAYKEYLDNGYSANYFNLVKKNPKGNLLYFKELYELNPSIYNVYGYILFSIYSKYKFKKILHDHDAKLLILIMYLPVFIISKLR